MLILIIIIIHTIYSDLGLSLGEDTYIDINSASVFGKGGSSFHHSSSSSIRSSTASHRRGDNDEIRLDNYYNDGPIAEVTDYDNYDTLSSAGRRTSTLSKRVRQSNGFDDDIEILRRADENTTPGMNSGVRTSFSAGRRTNSTVDQDDDRGSVVSELDDSVRRRRGIDSDININKVKSRSSLGAAAMEGLDDDDKYGLADALGLDGRESVTMAEEIDDIPTQHVDLGRDTTMVTNDDDNDQPVASSTRKNNKGNKFNTLDESYLLLNNDQINNTIEAAEVAASKKEAAARRREAKREQRKAESANRAADTTITISSDTLKTWLNKANTTDIVNPKLRGPAVLAHIHQNLEVARNKRLCEVKEKQSSFRTSGIESVFTINRMLGNVGISPAMWAIASRGKATERLTGDTKLDAAANRIALVAGTNAASAAACRARNLLGLPFGGIGDLTEDGDLAFPVPAIWDINAEMLRTNVRSNTLLSPTLGNIIYEHTHCTAKYVDGIVEQSNKTNDDEEDDEPIESTSTTIASSLRKNRDSIGNEDIGAYLTTNNEFSTETNHYDNDITAPGVGLDGAIEDQQWREDMDLGVGITPDIKNKSTKSPAIDSTTTTTTVPSTTEKIEPKNIFDTLVSLSSTTQGDDYDAVDGNNTVDKENINVSNRNDDVDVSKWHPETKNMFTILASCMTAPSVTDTPTTTTKSKKRKSTEADLAFAGLPDGDFSNLTEGKGSESQPLVLQDLLSNASKRTAAVSFFQLLALNQFDVIRTEQDQPYDGIRINRLNKFNMACKRLHLVPFPEENSLTEKKSTSNTGSSNGSSNSKRKSTGSVGPSSGNKKTVNVTE